MGPLGIHHVSLNVDNVQKTVAFYTEVLGFALRDDRPDLGFDGAWLDAGDQQLHLIKGNVPTASGQHFAVKVADLETLVRDLRGRGVAVSDPVPVGRSRQAFLSDPAGNSVELHEVGRG